MSSGPCQNPALANAWRRARPAKRGSARGHHAQRDDASLVFAAARPSASCGPVHRLLARRRAPAEISSSLADVRLVVASRGRSRVAPFVVRDVDGDVVARSAMPSARRVPESEVLRELDDRQLCRTPITRASRTTLMSGSGARTPDARSVGHVLARRHARARPVARAPPFEARDAGDEQHAGDQQDDAQFAHRAARQPRAPSARPRRRPPPRGASSPARSWSRRSAARRAPSSSCCA